MPNRLSILSSAFALSMEAISETKPLRNQKVFLVNLPLSLWFAASVFFFHPEARAHSILQDSSAQRNRENGCSSMQIPLFLSGFSSYPPIPLSESGNTCSHTRHFCHVHASVCRHGQQLRLGRLEEGAHQQLYRLLSSSLTDSMYNRLTRSCF